MRIAIIGCGYVGSAAASYLKRQGHTVTVSTRDPQKVEKLKLLTQNVILLKKDLYNELDLEPILANQDIVIVTVAPSTGASYFTTYLKTALRIRVLSPRFPKLRQIIYTSSTSVYGECDGREISEKEPVKPSGEKDSNINVLISTENTFREVQSINLHVAILRLGEIIGPGRELESRLRTKVGKPLPGTGENFTNFSPLDLIVKAIATVIRKNSHGVFNCCSEQHTSRKELYEKLCAQLKLPQVIWDSSLPQQHGGNKRVISWKLDALMNARAKL